MRPDKAARLEGLGCEALLRGWGAGIFVAARRHSQRAGLGWRQEKHETGISPVVFVADWVGHGSGGVWALWAPLIGFPTSAGDEWELENQGMVGALGDFIEAGRVKVFSVNSINGASFYNKGAHPFHRSWMQAMFDSYLRDELVPFIWDNCQSPGIWISTMGCRLGRITRRIRCSSIRM